MLIITDLEGRLYTRKISKLFKLLNSLESKETL